MSTESLDYRLVEALRFEMALVAIVRAIVETPPSTDDREESGKEFDSRPVPSSTISPDFAKLIGDSESLPTEMALGHRVAVNHVRERVQLVY